jgi:hypothetical protein
LAAFACIPTILLVGGDQENLNDHELIKVKNEVQNLAIKDGTLKFESIEQYENFFEVPESIYIPEFENLQKAFQDQDQISQSNLRISQTGMDANPFFVLKS